MQDKISLHMRFHDRARKKHTETPAHGKHEPRMNHAMLEVNPQILGHFIPSMPAPAPTGFVLLGQECHNSQPPDTGRHPTKPQGFLDTQMSLKRGPQVGHVVSGTLQGSTSPTLQQPMPMGRSALAWPVLLTPSPLITHHPEGFNPLFLRLSTRST